MGSPDFGLIAVKGLFPGGTHGDLTLHGVTLSGGSWFGGVQNRGALTIKNSTISGNTGAGVFNNPGSLIVVNSTISGNTRGGLDNLFGRITVQNSTISGNTGVGILNYGYGGFYGSVLTLTNSVVTGNQGAAPPKLPTWEVTSTLTTLICSGRMAIPVSAALHRADRHRTQRFR